MTFFKAPRTDVEPLPRALNKKKHVSKRRTDKMRYVAYLRISSEDQVGNYSIDAQLRGIEAWVALQGGLLTGVYKDEAQSGRTANRPAFQEMRKDARKGKFDAVVVHKFDRFARNRTDSLAIKSLLRYDYGIKVLSVSEPSEDSDGPMGALIEGIMESVADWYSRNLSAETQKGKKERSVQGFHNNIAPFGMKRDEEKILVPDEATIDGLKLAFESYATGNYSDNEIAGLLNDKGYRTKYGRLFSKDTVRDFLQNEIYLGKVSYQPYVRNSDGTRNRTSPVEWFDGKHEAVISEELYTKCQEIRAKRVHHHQPTVKFNHYLLRGIVYCYECCSKKNVDNDFPSYGKMRAQAYKENKYMCYRCRARDLGYSCSQQRVQVGLLDDQVVEILSQLKPPAKWRQNITASIGDMLGTRNLEERLEEIRTIIKRMDTRWDMGFFINEQEYIEQRVKLQHELEKLAPVNNDELERAADLLTNFGQHWVNCPDVEAKSELIQQIVQRVYVEGKSVKAITLRSNCHLVLGLKTNEPTAYTVDPFLSDQKVAGSNPEALTSNRLESSNNLMVSCGDDGRRISSRPYEVVIIHEKLELYKLHNVIVFDFAEV